MIKKIDHIGCIKCGLCEAFCPGNVIRNNINDGFPYIVHDNDCWNCFNCEQLCPVNAIVVAPFRKEKPLAWE